MNTTETNNHHKTLTQANYRYTGLLGGVLWAIALMCTRIDFGIFPQVFIITFMIIVFNIVNTKIMAKHMNIPMLSKIFAAAVNISFVTAIIYYTGGKDSNLWIMFLLAIMSFSLIYTKSEMIIAVMAISAVYSFFYLAKVDSLALLPYEISPMLIKIGLLFLAGITLKIVIDFQLNYIKTANELRELKGQLIQDDKINLLGKMMSSIAHELNNPLTGVIGFSQLLMDGEYSAEIKGDLKMINENALRCQNIVKNLLSITRRREREDKFIDLHKTVEDAFVFMRYHFSKCGVEIINKTDKYLPKIKADPYQLQQVFMNIISNACDSLSKIEPVERKIGITSELKDKKIVLRFSNKGPAISPEVMDNLFKPFYTTKEEGKGTGLGLCISREIIRQYGGDMYAESGRTEGVAFIIELPL